MLTIFPQSSERLIDDRKSKNGNRVEVVCGGCTWLHNSGANFFPSMYKVLLVAELAMLAYTLFQIDSVGSGNNL